MKTFIENALNRKDDPIDSTSGQQTAPEAQMPQAVPQQPEVPQNQFVTPAAIQEDSFDDIKDAKILVVGSGGMGNNAINRLHMMGISGAETVAINTDKQHLLSIQANKKILIGKDITRGLGAGGYPEKGRQAAQESTNDLRAT